MSTQYEKTHATTVIATTAILPNRFVSYAGGYASGAVGAGGLPDVIGISETGAEIGEAVSVVTAYSYPVEAGGEIAVGNHVKPGVAGRAVVGSLTDRCGIALQAAGAAGGVIEVRLLPHVHPAS
jgi:hypothetical protein